MDALAADSEKYYLVDGQPTAGELFDDLAGVYETKDGHVRLHTNFPQSVVYWPAFDISH